MREKKKKHVRYIYKSSSRYKTAPGVIIISDVSLDQEDFKQQAANRVKAKELPKVLNKRRSNGRES